MAVRISSGSSSGGTYPPAGGVAESELAASLQTKVNDNVAKSTVTTKGDLVAGTGNATVARLPVGADSTYKLVPDSTASTGMVWVKGGNGKDYIDVSAAPYSAALNGTTNDAVVIQNAINAAQGTNGRVLIPGLAAINTTLQMKSEMTLESLHFTRWPYNTYTQKSGLKYLGTFTGDCMIEFQAGVQWSNLHNIDINVNSQPATGTQCGGVYFTGLARSIELNKVGIYQPSGHGFQSRVGTVSDYARGLTLTTCRVWSAGNSSGANADGTQWAFTFNAFTDSSLIDCEGKDSRNGGFRISGAGDTELISCRAPYNRGGPGFYITGGDSTFASGNGGLRLTSCSSDRSYGEGLLIDAVGRQVIAVDNCMFRRDGSHGEAAPLTAAGINISGASSSAKAAPVLMSNTFTMVEDDDDNNGIWAPDVGMYLQHLSQMSMTNCHIWGRTTAITQGTGSTGGLLKQSNNWFYTGLPTAKTVVTPTIT
jgi:hypothetical protein